jgi:hypothetical protein
MFELLAIALFCLVSAKAVLAAFEYPDRNQKWRNADAEQRERIVREECVAHNREGGRRRCSDFSCVYLGASSPRDVGVSRLASVSMD